MLNTTKNTAVLHNSIFVWKKSAMRVFFLRHVSKIDFYVKFIKKCLILTHRKDHNK